MAAVGLVLLVAAVTIVVGRRRALPPAADVPELPAEPTAEPTAIASEDFCDSYPIDL